MRGISGTRLTTSIQRALLFFPDTQVIDNPQHQRRYSGLLDTFIPVFCASHWSYNDWISLQQSLLYQRFSRIIHGPCSWTKSSHTASIHWQWTSSPVHRTCRRYEGSRSTPSWKAPGGSSHCCHGTHGERQVYIDQQTWWLCGEYRTRSEIM